MLVLGLFVSFVAGSAVFSGRIAEGPVPDAESVPAEVAARAALAESKTSLPFIENEGQVGNGDVRYYVDTFAGDLFVTDSGLRYSMTKKTENGNRYDPYGVETDAVESLAFDERFLDGDGDPIAYAPHGASLTDIPVSYFHGSDPEDWKTGVRNYDGVSLGELWKGIDVDLKARGRNFEKIFTVSPGANPDDIAVGFEGVEGLSFQEDGTLRISTELGDISMTAPIAYQADEDGVRQPVVVSYDARDDRRYGFSVGEYDRNRTLVIDPLLAGTFIGTEYEDLYSIAIDSDGNVFVSGTTDAIDFPTSVGAYQTEFAGGSDDFFISKFDSELTDLLASTYLGGTGRSYYGAEIVLGPDDDVYMAGSSTPDYPVTAGAFQETCTAAAGDRCPVVSKLDNDLTALLASTYLGNGDGHAVGIAIDPDGGVFVTGDTEDSLFPVSSGAYKENYDADSGYGEVYVSKLDAALENIEASTFVGSGESYSVRTDTDGNVFIAGTPREHPSYPITDDAYDEDNSTDSKFFVSKLDNDLTELLASTYLGGSDSFMVTGNPSMMQVDSFGNVYLTELTNADDHPTTEGAYQEEMNPGGGYYAADIFISKLDNNLETLLASTFLGGSDYDESDGAMTIDTLGNVFVAAYTNSQDFPTTSGAYQETCDPAIWQGVVVSKLDSDLGSLLASTYLLTSNDDYMYPYALASDADGNVYIGGSVGVDDSPNTDFPVTDGAYQTVTDGGGGIFKFDNDLSGELVVTAPAIVTGSATDISTTSATLNATLTDDGNETPTVSFEYGTESGTYTDTCTPVTNDGNDYSCDLSGLSAGMTYYFTVSATNSEGTGSGDEESFETATDDSGPVDEPEDEPEDEDEDDTSLGDDECRPRKFTAWIMADGNVGLSWKKPCDLIDEIKIERKYEGGEFERIATVGRSTREYVDDGSELLPGTYTYRVRGFRRAAGKYSDYSSKKSVTVEYSEDVVVGTDGAGSDGTGSDEASASPVTTTEIAPPPHYPSAPADRSGADVSEPEEVAEPSVLGEIVAAVAGFARRFVNALVATVLVGLAAGFAVVVSPTGIPLFSTSPAPFSDFLARTLRIFGFVGKKKTEDDWGVVFDSETKRPIPGVPVSITDANGHVLGTSISDERGRYGFLPDPGAYTLGISKKGYELETAIRQDALYGELYAGSPVEIGEGGMRKLGLALRATSVDWAEFARRKVDAYGSAFSFVKKGLFLALFYAGFGVNTVIAMLYPTTLNAALFIAYLGMLAYYLFSRGRKKYGLVTDARTRQPVPFAMLSVFDAAEPARRDAFAVSDVLGRYFMFTENGDYLLKVSGRFLGGKNFEKAARVRVRDGVIRDDIAV